MSRNLTLRIVRILATGNVAACVVVGLTVFIDEPHRSGARHLTEEVVQLAPDLYSEKTAELTDLLECQNAKMFAVKEPAIIGFTCASVGFPGRFLTGFMFHGTVDVEYFNEKRARACAYARNAGRDLAYFILGRNWFVWTLYHATLEMAIQKTKLTMETLPCSGEESQ